MPGFQREMPRDIWVWAARLGTISLQLFLRSLIWQDPPVSVLFVPSALQGLFIICNWSIPAPHWMAASIRQSCSFVGATSPALNQAHRRLSIDVCSMKDLLR